MSLRIHRTGVVAGSRASDLIDLFPAGAVWMVDGTVAGTPDSDGNIVATSLTDLVGSTHLASSATVSKRPRGIPRDYLVNGRKSVLLDNDTTNGAEQYFADPTVDNAVWKPIVQIQHGPGATIVLSGIMRGAGNAAMLLGNFAGGVATPGFYIAQDTAGTINIAVWKTTGSIMINAVTPVVVPPHQRFTLVVRIRPNLTYSVRVNGVEVLSGAVGNQAVASNTFVNAVTIGANSGSNGSVSVWGGNLLCGALYHSALSNADCESIEDTIDTWYAVPAPSFNSSAVSGVTSVSEANVAVLGTSIDVGQNDILLNGYAGEVATNIAPTWSDLNLNFVGGYRYPGSIIDTMAVGGLTVRGKTVPVALNGFDSISADHPNRMDHQLATMATAGVFSSGLPLVLTCPLGWLNDLQFGFGSSMDHDRHGDLVRMLGRLVDAIRSYAPSLDVRIVLFTCTPVANVVTQREITLHNTSVTSVSAAIRSRTGCPVAVANMAGVITNTGTQTSDGIHPTAVVSTTLMAPVAARAIRYVCGLNDA